MKWKLTVAITLLSTIGCGANYADPLNATKRISGTEVLSLDDDSSYEHMSLLPYSTRAWVGYRNRINKSFERASLIPHSTVIISFNADGYPKFECPDGQDPRNIFYAEQAVWDGERSHASHPDLYNGLHPTIKFEADGTNGNNFMCTKLFVTAHPALANEVVVVHLINPYAIRARYPKLDVGEYLHSLENLAAISIKNLNSPLLESFRRERFEFLNLGGSAKTRETLNAEAQRLREKYKDLFVL